MRNKTVFVFIFIAAGLVLGNTFNFNLNNLYSKNLVHAYAYACKNLKTVGRTYCYDETSPNYRTIGLYENPNDFKATFRLKDNGGGIPLEILEKNENQYNQIFYKVKIKDEKFIGWMNSKFIKHE